MAERYNFLYRSLVGPVQDRSRYWSGYAKSDAAAEAFAAAIEPHMANGSKCGVSKLIRSYEPLTASGELSDVFYMRFTCEIGNTGGFTSIDIPLRANNNGGTLPDVSEISKAITDNLCDQAGNTLTVRSAKLTGMNVIAGGAVDPNSNLNSGGASKP